MVNIFKALSDESRLRILSLVWKEELCVCEIEKTLNLTQSNASRHLTALKNAGILLSFKQAQWAYYRLSDEFCENNKELCEYLIRQFEALPNYHLDIGQLKKCKTQNMCNTAINKE